MEKYKDFISSWKHLEQLFQLLITLAKFLFTTLFVVINDTSYRVATPYIII